MVSSDEYVSEGTGRKPFPGSAIVMVIPPRKWPPCPLKLACPGCPAPPRPTWCPCRPDCPALPRSPWCLCRPDCPWPTPVTVIGDNQNSHRNHQIKQDLRNKDLLVVVALAGAWPANKIFVSVYRLRHFFPRQNPRNFPHRF